MKKIFALALITLFSSAANAEYRHVNMTVFGMDCAPCAHAIHVSMKGIKGVDTVNVDLNTGLVTIALTPGNTAQMHQFEEAVEKNGFTHKDATVIVRGKITGAANAPVLEVTGTSDHYALAPSAQPANIAALMGKQVEVNGLLPQAKKGKLPDTLHYKTITEAQ
jgi:cation transport ATPase